MKPQNISLNIIYTLPGWLWVWFTGSVLIADLSAIFSTILLARWIWSIVGNRGEMIRFLRVGGVFLCLLQNITWLVASFLHRFSLDLPIEESLLRSMKGGTTVNGYALAIIFVTLFSFLLTIFGSSGILRRKEIRTAEIIGRIPAVPISKLRWVLLGLIGFEFFLIAKGIIGQRSMVVEGAAEGEQSFVVVILLALLPAQILLTASLLSALLDRNKWTKNKRFWLVFFLSLAVMLFIYFNRGRSGLVFAVLSFGYWMAFLRQHRPKLWKLGLTICVIYPILSQVLLFSNFIRSANSGIENAKGSAIDVIPQAWEKFRSSAELVEEEASRTSANLSTRPLVSLPLAMAIDLPAETKSFMFGENLFNSIIWAIPGPLFPNKKDYPIQETLLYQHFPIGDADTADSVYLTAYTEFSWAGLFVYPFLLLLYWLFVLKMLAIIKKQFLFKVIAIAVVFQLILLNIGEGALSNWLVGLRSIIFLFTVAFMVEALFGRRKRREVFLRSKFRIKQNQWHLNQT